MSWKLALRDAIAGLKDEDFTPEIVTLPNGETRRNGIATIELPIESSLSPRQCMSLVGNVNSRPFASSAAGALMISGFESRAGGECLVRVACRRDGDWNSFFRHDGTRERIAAYPEADFGSIEIRCPSL